MECPENLTKKILAALEGGGGEVLPVFLRNREMMRHELTVVLIADRFGSLPQLLPSITVPRHHCLVERLFLQMTQQHRLLNITPPFAQKEGGLEG